MFSWCDPGIRPVIVAHRGASASAPENTLAAFQRAIDDGADAIELDVRFSKDRELMVFHDSRLEGKSSGLGYARDATRDELSSLRIVQGRGRRVTRETIPTLSEVFELCGGRVGLNVEIKTDRTGRREAEIVDRCCALIKKYNLKRSVLVTSFHHRFIKHLKRHYPGIPGGLLVHPLKHTARASIRLAVQLRIEYLIFGRVTLRNFVVRKAHERHLLVGEFTVNTARRFERALRYGVDAVITNDPAQMKTLMASMK